MYKIRQLRGDRGSTLIEFALALPLLMFTVFWMFEMFLMIYSYNIMADAAKEGVRYAVVRGATSGSAIGPTANPSSTASCSTNSGDVYNRVKLFAQLSLHDITGMNVTVCYLQGSNQPPSAVQVSISYPLVPYFALPWSPPTVRAQAQGNIVY